MNVIICRSVDAGDLVEVLVIVASAAFLLCGLWHMATDLLQRRRR